MSRELKFRYFDGYTKMMVYSKDFPVIAPVIAPDTSKSEHQKLVHFFEKARYYAVCEGKDSVMQFTGLADANGKDIYEGDIVDFNGKKVPIEWNHSEAFFWGGSYKQRYIFQYCDMLKVVGNIFETPELLGTNE